MEQIQQKLELQPINDVDYKKDTVEEDPPKAEALNARNLTTDRSPPMSMGAKLLAVGGSILLYPSIIMLIFNLEAVKANKAPPFPVDNYELGFISFLGFSLQMFASYTVVKEHNEAIKEGQ